MNHAAARAARLRARIYRNERPAPACVTSVISALRYLPIIQADSLDSYRLSAADRPTLVAAAAAAATATKTGDTGATKTSQGSGKAVRAARRSWPFIAVRSKSHARARARTYTQWTVQPSLT